MTRALEFDLEDFDAFRVFPWRTILTDCIENSAALDRDADHRGPI